MQLVDNEAFLKQLAALFQAKQKSGTIWLTHKRMTYDGGDTHMATSSEDTKEYPCLLRVTDGKDAAFSTLIQSNELDRFHAAYGALLKSSMTSLRKRDKKREKQRAEDAARRKRRLAEEIAVQGPKRGNGRRKRQRKAKAALKLEESKRKAQEREDAKSRAKTTAA